MQKILVKSIKTGTVLSIVTAIVGLVYRSTVYWVIPVAENEPYGLSDIVDLGFFTLLFCLVVFTLLCSAARLAFVRLQEWKLSLGAILISIISFILYYNLHSLMPRLL